MGSNHSYHLTLVRPNASADMGFDEVWFDSEPTRDSAVAILRDPTQAALMSPEARKRISAIGAIIVLREERPQDFAGFGRIIGVGRVLAKNPKLQVSNLVDGDEPRIGHEPAHENDAKVPHPNLGAGWWNPVYWNAWPSTQRHVSLAFTMHTDDRSGIVLLESLAKLAAPGMGTRADADRLLLAAAELRAHVMSGTTSRLTSMASDISSYLSSSSGPRNADYKTDLGADFNAEYGIWNALDALRHLMLDPDNMYTQEKTCVSVWNIADNTDHKATLSTVNEHVTAPSILLSLWTRKHRPKA